MPAFPYNKEAEILEAAAKRLGWHPFPDTHASQFGPLRRPPGRACTAINCVGFACPVDAKNGTQNTVIPVAMATGNCELRTESVVSEVIVDDHGRAQG